MDIGDWPWPPPRVAVLGGTGFVGQRLSAELARSRGDVLRVARHEPSDGGPPACAMDLSTADPADIAAMLEDFGADVVVNAAGGMSGLTDEQMVAANVTLVENVLTAMTKMRRSPRLIHLGTVHEYGLAATGTSFDEAHEPGPVTTYAELKLRCTDAVTTAAGSGGVDAVVLRAGNITGGGQPAVSLLGVVAEELWAARCEGRRAAVTMKSLGALRDFMTLADAINAIVTVTKVPELPGRVFNIGTGRAACARDLVRTLIDVSGVPTDLVETSPGGPETTWQQMCVRKARLLLGWVPRHDLVDGIKELWTHHTEAREG